MRLVPQFGLIADFATGFSFGGSPRGIAVDLNSGSASYHDVFVSHSTSVKQYQAVVPGQLKKTYNAQNSFVLDPRQMSFTQDASGPGHSERLLVADSGQDRLIIINPATDRSRMLDVQLDNPRGLTTMTDSGSGAVIAYVGEPTRVVKLRVLRRVYVSAWVARGAGITEAEVRQQIEDARVAYEQCGFDIQLQGNVVNWFDPGALLDLEVTDWSQQTNYCGSPSLQRSAEERTLLDDTTRRGPEQSDVNLYFVRRLTVNGTPDPTTVAETVTSDCFPGLSDGTQSGVILSVEMLYQHRPHTRWVAAHELGHAVLDIATWAPGDEHNSAVNTPWQPPNLMAPHASSARVLFDPAQCTNINSDSTPFRSDP